MEEQLDSKLAHSHVTPLTLLLKASVHTNGLRTLAAYTATAHINVRAMCNSCLH